MLNATISPASIALAGNPVKLTINSSSDATYTVGGIFTGSVEVGTTDIFIDEILQGLLPEWSLAGIPEDQKNELLIPASTFKDYTITITNDQGENFSLNHTVIPGGISKETLRALAAENNNIFNFKLLNPATNLFMTSRTNGQFIVMRETEIMPLFFLYPGGSLYIKIGDLTLAPVGGIECRPYILNVPALRQQLFNDYNRLVNRFDIYFDRDYTATVILTPGTVTDARYMLEFQNSYGVPERIEVTGSVSLAPEADEEEKRSVYDSVVNDYVEKRDRRASRNILTVETGFKSQEELVFLIDLLASEHTRLLGYGEQPVECTVSAEDLSIALTSREPASLHLTLRFADKDKHHTHSFDFDFDSTRIHVDPFSTQFN